MVLMADGFASTPAGYISGIVIPLAFVLAGWLGKRSLARIDGRFLTIEKSNIEQSAAMTANTQALAIIVERLAPMQTLLAKHDSSLSTLSEATAVLKSRMDEHTEWARVEHNRILSGK